MSNFLDCCLSIRLITCTLCGSSQSIHLSTSFFINYGSCRGHRSRCSTLLPPLLPSTRRFLSYMFKFARFGEL
ncbi:hypothetical protein EDD16DRAFT_1683480 [Pisolithus croceorrhizus]|nr:hypothetical protein EDD16DRAFT_1683480 [Pisolithus croceorrhizus]KAI6099457.1 hypothetical protein EV401DRAFT_2034128 [Pisolithus croceorrhizus]